MTKPQSLGKTRRNRAHGDGTGFFKRVITFGGGVIEVLEFREKLSWVHGDASRRRFCDLYIKLISYIIHIHCNEARGSVRVMNLRSVCPIQSWPVPQTCLDDRR